MKVMPLHNSIGIKIHYPDQVVKMPMGQIKAGWRETPDVGVQVISVYDNHKFEKGYYAAWLASYDYYALTKDSIVCTNRPSEIPEGAMVKQGSEMDKDAFRELYNAAMHDYEF